MSLLPFLCGRESYQQYQLSFNVEESVLQTGFYKNHTSLLNSLLIFAKTHLPRTADYVINLVLAVV